MSVLPFLAVAIVGAVIATLLRDIRRLGTIAGLGAVVVALAAACFINPDTPLSIGGGALAGSDHLRLVLTLCLAGGLLVLVVARLATWQPSAPGALRAPPTDQASHTSTTTITAPVPRTRRRLDAVTSGSDGRPSCARGSVRLAKRDANSRVLLHRDQPTLHGQRPRLCPQNRP